MFPEVLQGIHPVIDFLLPSLLISDLYFTFFIPVDHELACVFYIESIRDLRRPECWDTPLAGCQRTTTDDECNVALLAKIAG